jgi:putative glutathione S-transferase
MFNSAFGDLAGRQLDLYPSGFREEIDRINALVYQRINNGAYKAGFARSQAAYDRAFARYFAGLDWLEALLCGRDWLAGTTVLSEADLRLFPTVYRHDAVYYARFKLNRHRITDYPRVNDWLERMLAVPGIAASSNMDHARNGYFGRTGNEIVPAGPLPLGLSSSDFPRAVWLNER